MNIETPNKIIPNIKRYDLSEDTSLKPWSAADEYLCQFMTSLEDKPKNLGIYNDRFGFLSCSLHDCNPSVMLTNVSQEKAIKRNLQENNLEPLSFCSSLEPFTNKMDVALVKIPKFIGLFKLFLEYIHENSSDDIRVICGFMTRHYNSSLLQVAGEYFDEVEQSRAVKKARLMTLTKKKTSVKNKKLTSLVYNGQEYRQYLGVFSGFHIDFATQFFLKHVKVSASDDRVLDLASGNGVIGSEIHKKFPQAQIDFLDDSLLAVASAKMNVQGVNIHHHAADDLAQYDSDTFDLIVTNPPFHFEYEINILVPLTLFEQCFRCLKKGGNLQIVANNNVVYKPHLKELFDSVNIVAQDKKFVVYQCFK